MMGMSGTPHLCEHCGFGHTGTCPRIKAIEYHQNGTVKRVEFHAPQPVIIPMPPPVGVPNYDEN